MSPYSTVYLAEKHSIAEALADVLPGHSVKKNGYIECGSTAVTWLSGHLLEQAPPEAYDPAYRRWTRASLPIVPDEFKHTVRKDRNIPKQLAVIKKLLSESPSAVNAADFDREGQLLVDEVLELLNYRGRVLRLATRALDKTSLTRELGRMQPDENFFGMRDAARARSELDWLAGMNLTRAMTLHGRSANPSGVLSLGRVQTPTLSLVVERDETIENFVPKTFYKVSCPFTAASGTFLTLLNPKPGMEGLDEENRLVDRKTAEAIRGAVSGKEGVVSGVDTLRKADPAPLPYSLTDIQKEASALYGMGASAVLDCCQELYEARFTSYPRTDCRYLPLEQFSEARDVLAAVGRLSGFEDMLAAADPDRRGACWNTSRVTAHHAIIPTSVPAKGLSEAQEKIYRLICRRYVWQFLPPHIYKKTRIDVACAGYDWRADGRTEVSPGWYAFRRAGLAGGKKADEKENEPAPLPRVEKGEAVQAGQAKVDEAQTTPPARFTEGTLVEAMENIQRYIRGASSEDKNILKKTEGLGTVATRATIIQTLLKRGYLSKKGRTLISTPTGRSLIHICPQSIKDPLMTADMERSLTEIQEGRVPYKSFVASYAASLPGIIDEIFSTDTSGFAADPKTLCPLCGKPLKRVPGKGGRWFWLCTGRPECSYAAADNKGRPGRPFGPKDSQEKSAPAQTAEGVVCPRCGKALVLRRGPRGSFWGCSGFPHCRFTCEDRDGSPVLPDEAPKKTRRRTAAKAARPAGTEPVTDVSSAGVPRTTDGADAPSLPELPAEGTAPAKKTRRKAASKAGAASAAQGEESASPACPRCGKALVLRKGPRGPFWGCSGFPRCRFTCEDQDGRPVLPEEAPKKTRRRTAGRKTDTAPQAGTVSGSPSAGVPWIPDDADVPPLFPEDIPPEIPFPAEETAPAKKTRTKAPKAGASDSGVPWITDEADVPPPSPEDMPPADCIPDTGVPWVTGEGDVPPVPPFSSEETAPAGKTRRKAAAKPRPASSAKKEAKKPAPDSSAPASAHVCPLCGRSLVRRRSQRGFFWGCSGYPDCRFTCPDRDGEPVSPAEAPKCPECGAPLRQVAIRRGPHAGSMAWLCSNDAGHASGKARFFDDRDGKPVFSGR